MTVVYNKNVCLTGWHMFDEEKDRYIPLFEGAGHKRQTKTERIRMEMKMEYHTLKNTASSCIHKTFMAAFSDYQVSVAMPLEAFERMLKRNGFTPDVSVGAFSDGVLVGFVLNGVRECNGVKTIYDLGTGVIPAFRRTGITDRLLNLVKAICIENNDTYIICFVVLKIFLECSLHFKHCIHYPVELFCPL